MRLTNIFGGVALMALHTGAAAVIAARLGSENPAAVGLTSFAIGIPSLLVGAFAGYAMTANKPSPTAYHAPNPPRATIGGLIGYATGSVIGFALKHL